MITLKLAVSILLWKFSLEYSLEKLTGDDIRVNYVERNAFKLARKWPTAQVPYILDPLLPSDRHEIIVKAMEEYQKYTCIKFIPRTTVHNDYIRFMDGGEGNCYSYVGRQGGAQDLSIGDGCTVHIGIILHEIAHALGFLHEHTRPDRDNFVQIQSDHIMTSRLSNFDKAFFSSVELHNSRYDYLSMMHYGRDYFSLDGEDTVVTLDKNYQNKIGQRENFSICDLEKINRHYNCTRYIIHSNPCALLQTSTQVPSTPLPTVQTPARRGAPPPDMPCVDDPLSQFCKQAYSNPSLCDWYPGKFLFNCKKACGNCDNKKCHDSTNMAYKWFCQRKTFPQKHSCIDTSSMSQLLYMLCPFSCGVCGHHRYSVRGTM